MTESELKQHAITNPKSKAKLIEDPSIFSTGGETYIQEKIDERLLKRSISIEKDTNATLWGKLLEPMVNELLPEEYYLTSKKRYSHPTIANWNGMPDVLTPVKVGDIKCPEPKAFMELLRIFKKEKALAQMDINLKQGSFLKKEKPEYYWQLVSNAILTGRKIAELIVFMPKSFRSAEVKFLCENEDDFFMQEKFKRIFYAPEESLAFMPDDCELDELNIFTFEVPQEDMDFLEERVKQANKRLENEEATKAE